MSKHSSGQWTEHPNVRGNVNIRADWGIIATVLTMVDFTGNANKKAEQIANARLIASAPEMLNALRRAALALAFAAESSPAMRDDYNAVSDAIAKATGAAPSTPSQKVEA